MMARLKHLLRESGLCIDRVRLLDAIRKRRWRKVLAFRFLRLRFSPAILEDARRIECSSEERGRFFSLAISYLNVGSTYKTTCGLRTKLADEAVLDIAKGYESPRLLEVGVSDGSSAQALLEKGDEFGDIVLTDRHNRFFEKKIPFGSIFLDGDQRLLGVKFFCVYMNLSPGPLKSGDGYEAIETVNPILDDLHGVGDIESFDIFNDRLPEKVQIIKCSNVLNLSYFSSDEIRKAVANLSTSLEDDGRIVVSQNNAGYADGEAVFVLRKLNGRLELEWEQNSHQAIDIFRGIFLWESESGTAG